MFDKDKMTKGEWAIILGASALWGYIAYKTKAGLKSRVSYTLPPIAPYQKFIDYNKLPPGSGINADWRYMYGDYEIPETMDSTDNTGGTVFYETHTISRNGSGVPRTDAERAMNHYGITFDEYIACPQCYPLPPRGTGLQ